MSNFDKTIWPFDKSARKEALPACNNCFFPDLVGCVSYCPDGVTEVPDGYLLKPDDPSGAGGTYI